jgi:hypothetical protein
MTMFGLRGVSVESAEATPMEIIESVNRKNTKNMIMAFLVIISPVQIMIFSHILPEES